MARARSFGNIRKLPSGRYQARYWHLGRQVPADDTFGTKVDARAWLASIETDIRRGEHISPFAAQIRFGDYAAEWLDARPIRPRTRATYTSQLAQILPTYAGACLPEITPHDVRLWHGRLTRSSLDRNTVAKVYRLFRTIMATAADDGLIRSNPVAIRVPRRNRSPSARGWHGPTSSAWPTRSSRGSARSCGPQRSAASASAS